MAVKVEYIHFAASDQRKIILPFSHVPQLFRLILIKHANKSNNK